MHFIVEEIDEDTSMEELQKMMLVALVYRVLVCLYEVSFQYVSKNRSYETLFYCEVWNKAAMQLRITGSALLCFQIVCIWGAGGATPGKFLIGLRVVTCDSSVLVQPNRVLVMPATNVSLSAWVFKFQVGFFFCRLFSLSSVPVLTAVSVSPLQINSPSLEQELFNCLLFPGLHHASVLPAQQDCLWHGSWNHCGQALQGQMMCKRVLIGAERAPSAVFVKHAGRTEARFWKSVARTQEHQDARRELDTRQYELSQLGFCLSQTHTVFSYVCFSTCCFQCLLLCQIQVSFEDRKNEGFHGLNTFLKLSQFNSKCFASLSI